MKETTNRNIEAMHAAMRAGLSPADDLTVEELDILQSELMQREKGWGAIFEAITWAYYTGYQRGAARKVKGSAAGKAGE